MAKKSQKTRSKIKKGLGEAARHIVKAKDKLSRDKYQTPAEIIDHFDQSLIYLDKKLNETQDDNAKDDENSVDMDTSDLGDEEWTGDELLALIGYSGGKTEDLLGFLNSFQNTRMEFKVHSVSKMMFITPPNHSASESLFNYFEESGNIVFMGDNPVTLKKVTKQTYRSICMRSFSAKTSCSFKPNIACLNGINKS